MPACASRVDLLLEQPGPPDSPLPFPKLKIGEKLRIDGNAAEQPGEARGSDKLQVCTLTGTCVGWISSDSLRASEGKAAPGTFQCPPFTATVRTVWHCKETQAVTKVQPGPSVVANPSPDT